MRDNKIYLIALGVFVLGFGCGKSKNNQPTAAAPAPVVAQPTPVVEQPKEKPVYVYTGDRFRDPFTPAGQSNNYQADAVFDPQKASVKGIVYGPNQKSAVLTVGGSGSYFVKGGRIFDIMGKTVDGFSAKIFVDKVVILGEADNVYELKIKTTEEAKKS